MEQTKYKFSTIQDPENCPIEDLEKEVNRLEKLGDFYETKQLALKKFLNSVYGATASKYFIAYNLDVAESITLQGQDLNHYSENCVNDYFSGIFQNDTELHKKLGITTEDAQRVTIDKGKTTETGLLEGEDFFYLKGNQSLIVAGDTDSCDGKTSLTIDDDKHIQIQELFNNLKYENHDIILSNNGVEIVPSKNHKILSYIDHNSEAVYKPIKYVMRHKVKKERYKIKTESGKEVIVTGDHSVMVIRNNELVTVKACELNKVTDKIITI